MNLSSTFEVKILALSFLLLLTGSHVSENVFFHLVALMMVFKWTAF